MVGTLTSLTTQIVSYYFGSSAGSKSKEEALINRPPNEALESASGDHG
ncbi:MAG: hypothetical protein HC777_00885 [Hyphomonadaceae bacterium]|nr:hypothetical protein [Hyphomonadaceae bacterium]